MSVDVNKSIQPVECKRKAPINSGSDFKAGNYIQFFIGASDVNMWLVNDSYLKLDISVPAFDCPFTNKTGAAITAADNVTGPNIYIKNAANLFDKVEILQASKVIYHEEHFIENNTIEQLELGEDYMRANPQMFTTNSMVANDGTFPVHLKIIQKGAAAADTANNANGTFPVAAQTIKDVLIPVNRLMRIFQDLTSEGFPIFTLAAPIELRLYIARPDQYLVDYNNIKHDFDDIGKTGLTADGTATAAAGGIITRTTIGSRLDAQSIKLENVVMNMYHYIPNESERAIISQKVAGEGMKFRYRMVKTAFRQENMAAGSTTHSIPFTLNTSNVSSILLWCHKKDVSPGVMFRPNIDNLYIQFGANQLPKQPIPQSSFSNPFDYKFTVDDVLNNIDTYYSQTNFDYNNSYRYINPRNNADTGPRPQSEVTVPTSTFIMMGANYVSDPDDFGADSKGWQGQYQAHFNSNETAAVDNLNYVLAVVSEYGMLLKDGVLDTKNI